MPESTDERLARFFDTLQRSIIGCGADGDRLSATLLNSSQDKAVFALLMLIKTVDKSTDRVVAALDNLSNVVATSRK